VFSAWRWLIKKKTSGALLWFGHVCWGWGWGLGWGCGGRDLRHCGTRYLAGRIPVGSMMRLQRVMDHLEHGSLHLPRIFSLAQFLSLFFIQPASFLCSAVLVLTYLQICLIHLHLSCSNFRFSPCIFKVNHFYWPTNALNCIKLKG